MQGYAIVDTGATRSMSGAVLLTHIQESLADAYGEDVMAVDPEATTRFTYANGSSDASYGQAGIPHELGYEASSEYLCVMAVPSPSPTFLGLDWMEAAGASLDISTGALTFSSRRDPVVCVRLTSGHWAVPLL